MTRQKGLLGIVLIIIIVMILILLIGLTISISMSGSGGTVAVNWSGVNWSELLEGLHGEGNI